jgi:hypothetical protein
MKVIRPGFGFSALLILLTAMVFTVDGLSKTLNPANRIVLNAQGQQSGQFNAPDLTVTYTCVRTGSNMQLSGNVQFGMSIQGNYAVVQTFQVGVVLADAQGNVLGEQQLTSAFDTNVGDTINFSATVVVPPQTASMAFTYNGQAFDAGRGGSNPTNFWFYPFTD